ncbi:hypothetical protein LCGC14_0889790, partial [marine sediment metagenome]
INESFVDGSVSMAGMEKSVMLFVEKLRAIRHHFTERIIVDKMLRGLARMHGYTEKPSTQVAHHYRIAKREVSDADLMIPTVEWDKPLEPHADLDYWDLLERLEQKNIPIPKRKWAQAAGYDFEETFKSAETDMDDRAKLYKILSAQAKQAEEAGFDVEGNLMASGEIGGPGGPGGGPGDFELGAGEGFELGGGGGGGSEFEPGAPPLEMELPAAPEATPTPEAAAPAGEGAGAGAAMEHARFQVDRPAGRFRYATMQDYPDLENQLRGVAVWDQNGSAFGLNRRRMAQLLSYVCSVPVQDRNGRYLSRLLSKEGLNSVQAGTVQYCAARLGFVQHPYMDAETVRHLQSTLVDLSNQYGLTKALTREFELLSRVAETKTKVPAAGLKNLTSGDQSPSHRVLTGVV